MNNDEWLAELLRLFPNEILGFSRPKDGIPTDLDFSTYFPQFISKDPARYDSWNAFLRQLFSNDKALNLEIDGISSRLASCDLRSATQELKGLMSAVDKKKLDRIEEGATKYVHPEFHPATMITSDNTHLFVTEAEKVAWNGKAESNHGNHVPKIESPDNARFLRNDGTWQTITSGNIGATAATMGGIVAGSLAQNGWVKFANGLILQWGFPAPANWVFPVPFSTLCAGCVGNHVTDSSAGVVVVMFVDKSLTGVKIATSVPGAVFSIAVGY